MQLFIYEHETYGRILHRKNAEELEKEATESGAKIIFEWVEDGRLYKMMQIGDNELWKFEYLLENESPLNAIPGRLIHGRKECSQ